MVFVAPGARSPPAILLASATGYQVLRSSACGKLPKTWIVDAAPSVPVVAAQGRDWKADWMLIVTGLSRIPPQRSAAYWKAMSRCWPTVVPELPPTGVAGVGSLKPAPGMLVLTMTISAAAKAGPASSSAARAKSWTLRYDLVMKILRML